eukprot:CAMPEP_0206442842 /NCGR_PEP_ID=MMETSP0324_2-20121206/14043_1 /ASSEMBLY_ACC=CAM_ASM_000836 /TAXON_ID=2866 /ORGANISM="Crypthecodinium cohnii, Strain Seligo" /LENGTH=34 /DNA_ID= /DNA_START= /DNA_END= /DNA_ORIENTATION=
MRSDDPRGVCRFLLSAQQQWKAQSASERRWAVLG